MTITRRRIAGVAGIAVLVCSALSLVAAPSGRADAPNCDWPMFGHDTGRTFASEAGCAAISPVTAATMKVKRVVNTSAPGPAPPAGGKGTVYAGGSDGTCDPSDAESQP